MPVPADSLVEAQERLKLMKLMDTGEYAIPPRQVDVNLMLATWNISQFSDNKTWRSIKYMADIIERFDLVAIQELKNNLSGLAKLLQVLPGEYRFIMSDTTKNYERFAFIYDTRTVEHTGLGTDIGLDIATDTHEGFQIHRMPHAASFRAGRFDFTIVNVHIFDSSSTFKEKEIKELATRIKYLSDREQVKVVDRDFFVVGDFNIKKKGDKFFKALKENGFTTPEKLDTLTTNWKRTGTYDKIAWVEREDEEQFKYAGNCNVVPFYKAVYQDVNPKGGYDEVSDHLPVWAEFEINELTQKLESVIARAQGN